VTGHDDELVPLQPVPPPSDPALPAALLLHAQALEGMRRAHAELLARLDHGAENKALVRALQELRDATERVGAAQTRAARRLTRTRRRLVALGLGLALLAGAGAALAGWAAREARRADDASRDELRAAIANLSTRLDQSEAELQGRLDGATAGRETALHQLADTRHELEALTTRAGELQRQQDELAAKAAHEHDQRLTELGEAAHVRAQLLESEQRFAGLQAAIAGVATARGEPAHGEPAPAQAEPAPAIVTTASAMLNLARRATTVLHASGAPDVALVEVQSVSQGALAGLLVKFEDPDGGPARVLRAATGDIVVDRGRTGLRLLDVATADGQPAPAELVPLPTLDRAAWEALGVVVPGDAASSSRLAKALGALVEPQGWHVAELRGCDAGTLVGLRLQQQDADGRVTRELRAERGVLGPGEVLELSDGTLKVGADERPFYQNVYRLPLPGADLGAWRAALAAEAR
jgi:hypothetical protein